MICSNTFRRVEIPPAQNDLQSASILFLSSPVNIVLGELSPRFLQIGFAAQFTRIALLTMIGCASDPARHAGDGSWRLVARLEHHGNRRSAGRGGQKSRVGVKVSPNGIHPDSGTVRSTTAGATCRSVGREPEILKLDH